ncbi:hypothetical protein BSZ35_16315 [Salinibacter sp. 10B]|uniref:hypothetical protein n=1 Tax=Salinibacter sp. 10B TaxID=1923971 RepID=UPI000CF372E6|nr:hypothetical protein [Salinibacter sp. 10B]PQJ35956.1 hypothetical protein BSZ35_16315 [Salinibacter sp. 10B]
MNRSILPSFRTPGALLLALVLVLALGWAHQAFIAFEEADVAGENGQRTVVVNLTDTPSTTGELHATLVSGELSSGAHEATVLSDRDCAPDANGISHCLNELALGDTRITVRHHHRMNEIPCLRPGETVTVIRKANDARRRAS